MSVGAGFFMLWLWDVFFVFGCDIGALAWVWTRTGRRNEREGGSGSGRRRVIEGAELRLKARAQGVGHGVLGVGRAFVVCAFVVCAGVLSELVLDAEVEELRVVLLYEPVVLGVKSDILILVIKGSFEDGAVALIEVCVVADVVPSGA